MSTEETIGFVDRIIQGFSETRHEYWCNENAILHVWNLYPFCMPELKSLSARGVCPANNRSWCLWWSVRPDYLLLSNGVKKTVCPICGQASQSFYDRKKRRVRELSYGAWHFYLELWISRVWCRSCQKM